MPPRIRFSSKRLRLCTSNAQFPSCQCRWASLATVPAPPIEQTIHAAAPITRYPPTQPPSLKRPEFRKTQLHRQYASLLRSYPLLLIFQHNNLRAVEWTAIRRELATALEKVDAELDLPEPTGAQTRIQVIQTGIFASALKVVEFWKTDQLDDAARALHPSDPRSATSTAIEGTNTAGPTFTHGLSQEAHRAAKKNSKLRHGLEPLMAGPLMLVTFPTVSPAHVKAALSILAPSEKFPAPKRKANPSYHDPTTQGGLQKLLLLGARVEGKAFDMDETRWVAGIAGGLDGLRGQLVAMLSSVGAGITNTLEAAGRSLYFTVESRRTMLEDEGKDEKKGEEGGSP